MSTVFKLLKLHFTLLFLYLSKYGVTLASGTSSLPFSPSCGADGCMEKTVLLHPVELQGLPSLQAWLPSLLRHEIETALEKLDLVWDRTYAWDMFLDMMVGGHVQDDLYE